MPPKQDSNSKEKKRVRKTITMEVKSMILKLKDRGCSTLSIGRGLDLSRTTVQTLLKDKEKLLTALPSVSLDSTIIRKKDALICEMEKLLYTWIQNQTQRRVPLSLAIFQNKALSIINTLQNKPGENNSEETKYFSGSCGWFMRFKTRYLLHNIRGQGEATGADHVAAQSFPGILKEIIESGDYSPKQIFNMDETGLFGKQMPSRTFTGFKAAKDRLMLLLGSNVEDQPNIDEITTDIVHLANRMPDIAVTADDIDDMLCSHSQELIDENLIELEAQVQEEAIESQEIASSIRNSEKELTLKKLSVAYANLENAMKMFDDPNFERSFNVKNKICAAYKCYQELYDSKKNRATCLVN
ncbi:unnamed protein product [Hermetia illucens]|uniref:HTH CENPB-type domain-containing protein n=1 Tax=Hermetia illucens TaxID=343691 RepID=A0A7R8YXN8_HERIL|nr:unnamed protein product [Hermetia illucens]